MRRHRLLQKALFGLSAALAGGMVLGNGCINTLASVPICGTVLTFCTPQDQLNLMYPMLDLPNFDWDPSCTIPLGCGDGDLYPPNGGNGGYPGGDSPDEPSDTQSGGQGGGG